MKHFNNIRIVNSFREISSVLEIVSMGIKIFTLILMIFQMVMLLKESKEQLDFKKFG